MQPTLLSCPINSHWSSTVRRKYFWCHKTVLSLLDKCHFICHFYFVPILTTFHVLSHLGLHFLLEAHTFLEKTPVLAGWGISWHPGDCSLVSWYMYLTTHKRSSDVRTCFMVCVIWESEKNEKKTSAISRILTRSAVLQRAAKRIFHS